MTTTPSPSGSNGAGDAEHLVFSSAGQLFALPYQNLLQIIDAPACTSLPLAPPSVRGVIDAFGTTVPLIDLRVLLGVPSLAEETNDLIATIAARRQDHIGWLHRLKDAVEHEQEITVQTDPHKCNFGLWYDRFTTSSSNFARYLKLFDEPHKAVHSVALQAKELMQQGRKDEAKELIHATEHSVLAGLLALFDGFEAQLRRHTHEYALVLERDGGLFAVAVDSLAVFDRLEERTSALPPALKGDQRQLVTAIGRLSIGSVLQDVLILDPARIHPEDPD